MTTESDYLHKTSCPSCGSSDANAVYSDGHTHCFSCGVRASSSGQVTQSKKKSIPGLLSGEYQALQKRCISEDTCRKFGYQVGSHNGKPVQIAPYFDGHGNMVAQKVRYQGKDFSVRGDLSKALLFGANLWDKGRRIVVTEGEIDAMSVSIAQGNKWPVVSVPNGAQGAKKSLQQHLEYLNGFEEVVLMFDMDEPGQKAAAECTELFPPGKVKIASLPLKDANECLMQGNEKEILTAIWNAKTYRPDGLVSIEDILPELEKPVTQGLPWFLPTLTKVTFGRRYGEVYGLGAGTGVGKTDFFTQQMEHDINVLGLKVGGIFLEQKPIDTAIRVAGKQAGKKLHVPDGSWEAQERTKWVSNLRDKLTLYDSFGQTDWTIVSNKIRFMVVSEGIRIFYLDHLTAMADTADEKGSLEQIMKEMAGLANELQIIIHFISHLATPEGKPHEEGGRVSIRHFKGSRAIGFWAYFLFGMERDQQHEDIAVRQTTTFRILKDRFTGQSTGTLIYLGYDSDSGKLYETEKPDESKDSPFKDEADGEDYISF